MQNIDQKCANYFNNYLLDKSKVKIVTINQKINLFFRGHSQSVAADQFCHLGWIQTEEFLALHNLPEETVTMKVKHIQLKVTTHVKCCSM